MSNNLEKLSAYAAIKQQPVFKERVGLGFENQLSYEEYQAFLSAIDNSTREEIMQFFVGSSDIAAELQIAWFRGNRVPGTLNGHARIIARDALAQEYGRRMRALSAFESRLTELAQEELAAARHEAVEDGSENTTQRTHKAG